MNKTFVVADLKSKFQDSFNTEVAKLTYKVFIYKANANILQIAYLKKILNTPQKVFDLANEIGITNLPTRTIAK